LDAEGYRLTLPAGSIIFTEGQVGDCAYIINEGEIGLSTQVNNCSVQFIVARTGDLIGEMALIDDGTRLATAKVLRDVELLVIPKDFIKRVFTEADPTMVLLVKLALERYRNMRIRLEQFSRGDDTEKADTICATTAALLKHQTRPPPRDWTTSASCRQPSTSVSSSSSTSPSLIWRLIASPAARR